MRKEANDLIEGKTKVIKNEHISAYAQSKIDRLEQENTKLRIALCNLRDDYLDMGGDPEQLELFDKDDVSQLSFDFEVTDNKGNGDFKVK
tara:strand:+ start:191 stop:460 length:270 start_codon:yes stop_codon:yes gene_type:complete